MTTTYCGGLGCSGYSGSAVVNLGPLPTSGTYTLLIQQTNSNLAVANANLGTLAVSLAAPLTGTLSAGSPANEHPVLSGQPMQLAFAGSSGQYLSLGIQEAQYDGISGAAITILKPDGSVLSTATFTATLCTGMGCGGYYGNTVVNLGPLPATGTYNAVIQQNGAGTGTLTLQLYSVLRSRHLVGGGTPSSAGVSLAGQSIIESLAGSAGQFFALGVSESDSGIAGASIALLAPDGSKLNTGTFVPTVCNGFGCSGYSGTGLVNMGPLSASGTYNIYFIQQTGGGTGSLTLTLTNPNDGGVLSPGTPTIVPAGLLAQGMHVSFSGTAGTAVSLHVQEDYGSNITGATLFVLNPDGSPLANGTLNAATCGNCNGYAGAVDLNLPVLPQTGTYHVVAQQKSAATGTLAFTGTGVQPATGSTWNLSTSTAGQGASFTFSGAAGQSLAVAVSNLVLNPAGNGTSVNVTVSKPDGSILNGYNGLLCRTDFSGQCVFPMMSLPVSGTYTVKVVPNSSSQTMSCTATLSADVTGTLTSGTAMPVTLGTLGQNALLSFTATADQTFGLYVAGIVTTPANSSMQVTVYDSAGAVVGTPLTTSSNTTLNVSNLAADTYRVLISPRCLQPRVCR